MAASCPSPDSVRAIIRALFPHGIDRTAAIARFNTVVRVLNRRPHPDTAAARQHAMNLIAYTLRKYEAGQLTHQPGPPTPEQLVAAMVNGVLCLVGLPQTVDDGALGDEGEIAVVTPTTDTTLVTESGEAGVDIDPGDVPTTTVITITRLPDDANPLLTPFDQYPMFFEFHASPAPTFTNPVVVGVCLPDGANPPDLSRLRLAHNVAPFTWGSIEVLPLVSAPFLDCSNASLSAAPPSRSVLDVASHGGRLLLAAARGLIAPRALYAAAPMFATGIGGSVRTFSPFGLVDTLGIVHAATGTVQNGKAGLPSPVAPTVHLLTPTRRPMDQVPVVFAVTQGGGTAVTPLSLTDVTGRAATVWILGSPGPQTITATPQTPAGTGFSRAPATFRAQAN